MNTKKASSQDRPGHSRLISSYRNNTRQRGEGRAIRWSSSQTGYKTKDGSQELQSDEIDLRWNISWRWDCKPAVFQLKITDLMECVRVI